MSDSVQTSAPAPARTPASSAAARGPDAVAAKKAAATTVAVKGADSRKAQREQRAGRLDSHAIRRQMTEGRDERHAVMQTLPGDDTPAPKTDAPAAPTGRDAKGRFVPKTAPTTESPQDATRAEAGEEQGAPEAKAEGAPVAEAKPDAPKPEADERVKSLEQRYKQQETRAARAETDLHAARETIADKDAELEMLRGFVRDADAILRAKVGAGFDPVVFELARAKLANTRYERQTKAQQQAQTNAAVQQVKASILGRVEAASTKHPELRSAQGQAWIKSWLSNDAVPLSEFEAHAEAYATFIRAQQVAAHKQREVAAQPPKPRETPRPDAQEATQGGAGAGQGEPAKAKTGAEAFKRNAERLSTKNIKESLRMVRGGRG